MGTGMLFAGAMTGVGQALGSMADNVIKREDDQRKYQFAVQERRDALLYEMEMKERYARRAEEASADAFNRVAQRGEEIGYERGARELESARSAVPNEGEFANDRVMPDMLASMPHEARSIYEQQMGLTDDSELQGLRDQVQASGEVAAPSSVRKAMSDNYREGRKADKEEKDRKLRNREMDQQWTISEANRAAADVRLGRTLDARGQQKSGDLSDVQKAQLKPYEIALKSAEEALQEAGSSTTKRGQAKERFDKAVRTYNDKIAELSGDAPGFFAQPSPSPSARAGGDVGALEREIAAVTNGRDSPGVKQERLQILNTELRVAREKAGAAPSLDITPEAIASTARKYGISESEVVKRLTEARVGAPKPSPVGAPKMVLSKSEFDALPSGTTFIAPDGTQRRKP